MVIQRGFRDNRRVLRGRARARARAALSGIRESAKDFNENAAQTMRRSDKKAKKRA